MTHRPPFPADATEYLRGLLHAARYPFQSAADRDTAWCRVAGYRDLALEAGWSPTSFAEAAGTSRQNVQQWGTRRRSAAIRDGHPPIPPVPEPAPAPERSPPPARPGPNPEETEALRRLAEQASRVRGWTPADHPDRQASEEFTALLHQLRTRYSVYSIGRAAGITPAGVNLRLARHGYPTSEGYVDAVADQGWQKAVDR